MFFRKKKVKEASKKREISKNDRATIDKKAEVLEDFVEKQDPKKDFLGSMSEEELARAISDLLKKSKSN